MTDDADISILRCPLTAQPLRRMTKNEIDEFNRAQERGELAHVGGEPVQLQLNEGVISADGAFGYFITDGIFGLLPHSAITIPGGPARKTSAVTLRPEKEAVQRFYEDIGWTRGADGLFGDTAIFVDQRPFTKTYIKKCNLRVNEFLLGKGTYFLDAGCGAIPHPEYLTYSEGFKKRICIDLSLRGLREARRKLGDRGIYVQGDITAMPIVDDVCAGAVALHSIYHVPENEQCFVLEELHRVLKPGHPGVVVYAFDSNTPLMRPLKRVYRVLTWPRKVVATMSRRTASRDDAGTDGADSEASRGFYFHAHPYEWFRDQRLEYLVEIRSWRSLNSTMLRRAIHGPLLGGTILRVLFWLEGRFPHALGRVGEYPLIILRG